MLWVHNGAAWAFNAVLLDSAGLAKEPSNQCQSNFSLDLSAETQHLFGQLQCSHDVHCIHCLM